MLGHVQSALGTLILDLRARQVHTDHVPQVPRLTLPGPGVRGRRDHRRTRAGLGLDHRAHGAQRHSRRALLRIGHAVGGRSVHVGLRVGHRVVLERTHVVAVHGLHLRRVVRVQSRVLRVTQLFLHHAVASVGPAVHVGITVHPLVDPSAQTGPYTHTGAHGVAARRQKPARHGVLVLLHEGLGFPPGSVFVIRVFLHVESPEALGFVDERPLLTL